MAEPVEAGADYATTTSTGSVSVTIPTHLKHTHYLVFVADDLCKLLKSGGFLHKSVKAAPKYFGYY